MSEETLNLGQPTEQSLPPMPIQTEGMQPATPMTGGEAGVSPAGDTVTAINQAADTQTKSEGRGFLGLKISNPFAPKEASQTPTVPSVDAAANPLAGEQAPSSQDVLTAPMQPTVDTSLGSASPTVENNASPSTPDAQTNTLLVSDQTGQGEPQAPAGDASVVLPTEQPTNAPFLEGGQAASETGGDAQQPDATQPSTPATIGDALTGLDQPTEQQPASGTEETVAAPASDEHAEQNTEGQTSVEMTGANTEQSVGTDSVSAENAETKKPTMTEVLAYVDGLKNMLEAMNEPSAETVAPQDQDREVGNLQNIPPFKHLPLSPLDPMESHPGETGTGGTAAPETPAPAQTDPAAESPADPNTGGNPNPTA